MTSKDEDFAAAAVQALIDLILNNCTEPNDAAMAIFIIGEGYYYRGMEYHRKNNRDQARDAYQKAVTIWQKNVDQVVTAEYQCGGYYGLGLAYWQLGQWFPAADALLDSLETDPNHQFAGSMCWLVSDCYEKLKRDGVVSAEEADPLIEWGYQTLFDRYPDSRDVEYAAIQLGKLHLARGEPVSACVYFNWFLDHTFADNGQIADIGRIMERMEGCSR